MTNPLAGYAHPKDVALQQQIERHRQAADILRERATTSPRDSGGHAVAASPVGVGLQLLSGLLSARQRSKAEQVAQQYAEQRHARLLPVLQQLQKARSSEDLWQAASKAAQAGDMELYKTLMQASGQQQKQETKKAQWEQDQATKAPPGLTQVIDNAIKWDANYNPHSTPESQARAANLAKEAYLSQVQGGASPTTGASSVNTDLEGQQFSVPQPGQTSGAGQPIEAIAPIGFTELTEMRQQSPTGGNVSATPEQTSGAGQPIGVVAPGNVSATTEESLTPEDEAYIRKFGRSAWAQWKHGGGGETPSNIRAAEMYLEKVNAERMRDGKKPLTFEQAFNVTVRAPTYKETAGGFVTPTPEGYLGLVTDPSGLSIPLPREADPGLAQNMEAARKTGAITADQYYGVLPPRVPSGSIPAPGAAPSPATAPGAMPAPSAEMVNPQAPQPAGGLGYKKSQEFQVTLAKSRPKAQAALDSYTDKITRVLKTIEAAKDKATRWSSGWGSLFFSRFPETDAKSLAADLAEIKANIGFTELTEMRQQSPTGGALGQVAVQELVYLQSTLGTLDQELKPPELVKKLDQVSAMLMQSQQRLQKAFIDTYEGGQVSQPPAVGGQFGEAAPPTQLTSAQKEAMMDQLLLFRKGQ